jgi:hypothetical protein
VVSASVQRAAHVASGPINHLVLLDARQPLNAAVVIVAA